MKCVIFFDSNIGQKYFFRTLFKIFNPIPNKKDLSFMFGQHYKY